MSGGQDEAAEQIETSGSGRAARHLHVVRDAVTEKYIAFDEDWQPLRGVDGKPLLFIDPDGAVAAIKSAGQVRPEAICLDCGAPLWARSHTWCERTELPFHEHRIFARFAIMPAFPGEDVADEYALERDAVLGVIVWGLFRGQWIRQPWNMSPVNRWLVARIDELKRIKEAP